MKTATSTPKLQINLSAARIFRDGRPVDLRPKTWAVLLHLVERPGALVGKTELLDAVWPDTAVTEGTLNKSIAELREALDDDRSEPRFVETVPRRGFRWIADAGLFELAGAAAAANEAGQTAGSWSDDKLAAQAEELAQSRPIGREQELDELGRSLSRALAGTRQLVFLTGEAGAGKSTLVDAFVARARAGTKGGAGALRVAQGQCIDAFGQHEPYRPFLEALERLAAQPGEGAGMAALLRTHAPSWLRQMPAIADAQAPAADDSVTPARMLRELATFLEELSRERPLLLVLEDVHWADLATMDALNLVARRRDPVRLLLLATLRSADAQAAQHPVIAAKSELTSKGQAQELPLALFTPGKVERYLEARCPGIELDPGLCSWIHHQTAGNPLFVRIVVDELVQRGLLRSDESGGWKLEGSHREIRDFVPDSLRELVERQLDRLPPLERSVTEAASVLPRDFSPAMVAAVAELEEEEVEDACVALARRAQVLRRAGRPGQRSDRFAFVHSMVQRIMHDGLPASRLRRLHLAAAAELERRSPGKADVVAVQLALHYAMARDTQRAIQQLQYAASLVSRIPAPREVIVIREQILDLLESSPEMPGFRRARLVALMDLITARQLAYGSMDAETTVLCERALELAVMEEDAYERLIASLGVFWGRQYVGRYAEALAIAQKLLADAIRSGSPPLLLQTLEFSNASVRYRLGDFDEAEHHFRKCLEHAAETQQTFGWNFPSMSLSHLALIAIHRGRPDEARRLVEEARNRCSMTSESDISVLPSLAYAFVMLREDAEARPIVDRSLAMVDRAGSAAWIERARFLDGILTLRAGRAEEGLAMMQESLSRQLRERVHIDHTSYCCLCVEEMLRLGLPGADAVLASGFTFMERSGEKHSEGELYRLRAEVRLASDRSAAGRKAAAADLRRAVEAAKSRGARQQELAAGARLAGLD